MRDCFFKNYISKLLRKTGLLMLLLLAFFRLHTQNIFLKELSVGDSVPDIEFKMVNYPKGNIKLSEFKGKFILFDFWATWCAPCVASFPKLDSLQRKFKDKIQILPVTYQDKSEVNMLLERMAKVNQIDVPISAVSDSFLHKMFRRTLIPHYVWVNDKGIVKFITGQDEITTENLLKFINNDTFSLPQKNDLITKANKYIPVFLKIPQITIAQDKILFRKDSNYASILTKKIEELSSGTFFDSNRVIGSNLTIKELFKVAFGARSPAFLSDNRVILNVRDSSLFDYPNKEDRPGLVKWFQDNSYCYEIMVAKQKDTSSVLCLSYMQKDLNDFFSSLGITGAKRTVKQRCLILRIDSLNKDNILTAGGAPLLEKNAYYYKMKNLPLSRLVNDLRTYYWQKSVMPLVDLTSLSGNIDLDINANMSDVDQVRKEIAKFGLEIMEGERDIEMIVISQK